MRRDISDNAIITGYLVVGLGFLAGLTFVAIRNTNNAHPQSIAISDARLRRTVFRREVNGTRTGILGTVEINVPQSVTGRAQFVAILNGTGYIRTIRLFRIVAGEEIAVPVGWDDRNHESKRAYEFEAYGMEAGKYRAEFAIRGSEPGGGTRLAVKPFEWN